MSKKKIALRWTLPIFLGLLTLAWSAEGRAAASEGRGRAAVYDYRVIRSHPHDRESFTQGLAYDGGFFYEGTGLHGRSRLRKVDPATGRVLREVRLSPDHFGEGIAVFGNRIFQLTWRSRTGFVYDRGSFGLLRTFSYDHEGWGVTHDGRSLIVSDGSSTLRRLDPQSLRETGRLRVRDDDGPVEGLNELEYVRGAVYANVWPTDSIVAIDPRTGRVTARIDLTGMLRPEQRPGTDVTNGIAYDPATDRLFVTGKLWPELFEIRLVRRPR